MANLRQLSVFSLALSLLAGSSFSLNCEADATQDPDQLNNPPPSNQVFYEGDLWQHDANREWVFTHLLLSAIRSPNGAKIDKMQVTSDTKESLHTIRQAFLDPDSQSRVETASMSDLVYAYSWSNACFTSYMFNGLLAIKNKFSNIDRSIANNLSFYKQHKFKLLGTGVAVVGAPAAFFGSKILCAPPVQNPAQGWFLKRHLLNAGKNIAEKAGAAKTVVVNHPYVAGIVAGVYLSYEAFMTAANRYCDVPTALMYYTDRIAGGDGSAQAGTFTNTFYGFSHESAGDHFRWYIDMNLYNTMLQGFLLYGKRINQLQFGPIPRHAQTLLDSVSNNGNLSEMIYTPYLPDYFDRRSTDYAKARDEHRKQVTEVVNKAVDIKNPADDCRKFLLFNDALLSDNPDPLYLFSLCSVGDTFAYASLPWFPSARLKKTEVAGFVQELMEYTGSTRLVVMSEKSAKSEKKE